jgi:hypothetical protein
VSCRCSCAICSMVCLRIISRCAQKKETFRPLNRGKDSNYSLNDKIFVGFSCPANPPKHSFQTFFFYLTGTIMGNSRLEKWRHFVEVERRRPVSPNWRTATPPWRGYQLRSCAP